MKWYAKLALTVAAAAVIPACSDGGGSSGGGGGAADVPLYGVTRGSGSLGNSVLVQINPSTGALIQTIGDTGYYVNGLEYDPVSKKLYATTSNGDPNDPDSLIEIDMTTGVGTLIGAAGMNINNPTVNSVGEVFAWTESGDDLIIVDTATGTATVIGNSGVSSWGHGLAFDENNDLYMVNGGGDIYSIDPVTGASTFKGYCGAMVHHGDVNPLTGKYVGIGSVPWNVGPVSLLTVNLETATIEGNLLPTVDNLFAVTFAASAPSNTAPKMYGTTFGNGTLGASVLVQLSTETGALVKTIGSVGYYVNGLTYDPVNGRLFGTTSYNDPVFGDGLISIDTATGTGTPIGQPGFYINNPTVNSEGEMFAWTESSDDLVSVNTATGAATVVGDSGISTQEHGVAFAPDDRLYIVNSGGGIYSVNVGTGVAAAEGTLGVTNHHGDFDPRSGRYWGINNTGTGPKNLLVANIATPAIVRTLPTLVNLMAVTFAHKAVSPVKLYATTVGSSESVLSQFSAETGRLIRTIGPVGYYVNGLEYDPKSDTLYATTSANDPVAPASLIRINRLTGASTLIGGIGTLVMDLAVNSEGQMFSWAKASGLLRLDTSTGVATHIGSDLEPDLSTFGLAIDSEDAIWFFDDGVAYTIDPLTGVTTNEGSVTTAHHGDFHPTTGRYWGINTTGSGPKNFVVVNVEAMTSSTITAINALHCLTFCSRD